MRSGVELKEKAVQSKSRDSSLMNSFEKKNEKLEDLASSIFVQRNLKSEGQISFVSELPKEVAVTQKPMTEHLVRSNLYSDMKLHLTRMVQNEKGGQISLELRPGDMGSVKVEVSVTGENLKIEMSAEKSSAESLLKSQAGELKSQLVSAGFKVDELQVGSQRNAQMSEGRDFSQSGRNHQEHAERRSQEKNEAQVSFEEEMRGVA